MKRVFLFKHPPIGRQFLAINLFGFILTRRPLSAVELNHERIHTVQQRELLYVFFYLWYVCEWLYGLVRYRNGMKAYRQISFEKEAYRHQHDLDYLSVRRHYCYNQ
ncbi:MAG: hypothetical protein IJ816_01845 [Alloprevotella sp.]|nr:hypothetical protein [Alloprevotella sp.]